MTHRVFLCVWMAIIYDTMESPKATLNRFWFSNAVVKLVLRKQVLTCDRRPLSALAHDKHKCISCAKGVFVRSEQSCSIDLD